MTTLGAALYTGFFVMAALWLLLTAEAPVDPIQSDGASRQDLTSSASTEDAAPGSRRSLAHSSRR
jgi:hypothetical protein